MERNQGNERDLDFSDRRIDDDCVRSAIPLTRFPLWLVTTVLLIVLLLSLTSRL
jgi:hypothetical protein